MKIFKKIENYWGLSGIVLLALPTLVSSQFGSGVVACDPDSYSIIGANFKCSILHAINLIDLLIPVLFGLAFIVFFWGLSKFILSSGSPEGVSKGKSYMFWGILALFVLVTARAIIPLIASTLEIGSSSFIIPQLKSG